jgi:hypothetical protein
MAAAGPEANVIGDEGAVVFVDDVLCYTKRRVERRNEQQKVIRVESERETVIRHFKLVARVVRRFRNRNMTISVEKSFFGRQTIKYLGIMLGRDGMSIDKQKQKAILDAPHPKTAAEVHRLIGAAVWLGRVLRCNLSNLLAPLRTNSTYHHVGGDEHVGICDARFAELVCHNRLERTIKNAKTGHRFVTAEDQLVVNCGMYGIRRMGVSWRCSILAMHTSSPCNLSPLQRSASTSRTSSKDTVLLSEMQLWTRSTRTRTRWRIYMVEQADAHGVTTREEFMLATHASPRQIDEIIREGSVQGLEGALKRSVERRKYPLQMAPDDGCYSKMQGNMRPPQSKTHRHHSSPYGRVPQGRAPVNGSGRAGEGSNTSQHGGLRRQKSTSHLSVQLYKSEAAGGRRKTKDLLAEELNFREHDDVEYTGVKLALRFITSDSEAKLISDGVENLYGERKIAHLKSPPRSHRYYFIEGRMKALVSAKGTVCISLFRLSINVLLACFCSRSSSHQRAPNECSKR